MGTDFRGVSEEPARYMGIGTHIRRAFGSLEVPVSKAYRGLYIDLDAFARELSSRYKPRTIIEVGCGDGLFTSCLARSFPETSILGIDIAQSPGRLFEGNRSQVEFRSEDVTAPLRRRGFEPVDLVVIIDVIHHVSKAERKAFLASARALAACSGVLVIKEWAPTRTLAHYLCWFSDRVITGDRVSYATTSDLMRQLTPIFPDDQIRFEGLVGPRSNNYFVSVRR